MQLEDYEIANRTHRGAEADPFTAARYAQFARLIPSTATNVLDVGASTGRGGVELTRLRPDLRLTALDCVAERLEALPPSVYADAIHSSSTAIPCEDCSFDAVVAGEFIEHLAFEDVSVSLSEFVRVLSDDGVLILTTPNPRYLRLRMTGRTVIGGAHLSEHTPDSIRSLFETHGLTVVRVLGSGRVSGFLGQRMPLSLYGSFLVVGRKTLG